jgi:hypothetical protein
MKTHNTSLVIGLVAVFTLFGCSSTAEKKTPEKTLGQVQAQSQAIKVNDYPTRDRVEYVLNCVAQHGGLTFITQYACGCKIDKIAEKLSFAEYEVARTFSMLRSTPGEAGGVFRDPQQAKDLRKQLKEAEVYADKSCFVK